MRKAYILSVFFAFCTLLSLGQARINFQGDIEMSFNGGTQTEPIFLVVDNPNPNAITSAGPVIRSESEFNIVKWNTRTTTGTFRVPFLSLTGGGADDVSTQVTKTSAGTETNAGSGTFLFATYNHDNSLATTPTDVTHMDYVTGGAGGENDAIDRFWIIDSQGYSTRPSANIRLFYDEDEFDGGMAEPNLLLQRFNSNISFWFDYDLSGSVAIDGPNNNISTTVAVDAANFFRSWTITNSNNPLPIELTRFQAQCLGNDRVELQWTTASETNNDFFTLERSEDGIIWEAFLYESGAGNSSQSIDYSVIDENPFRGLTYYRLTQTDYDGRYEVFEPTVSDCDGVGFEIINAHNIASGDMMQLTVSAGNDEVFDVELLDLQGKRMAYIPSEVLLEGLNYLQFDTRNVPYGIYVVRLQNETRQLTRKVQLY